MVGHWPPVPPDGPPRSSESRMKTKAVKRTRNPPAKRRALVNLYDTGTGGSGSASAPGNSSLPPPSAAGSISVDKDKELQNLEHEQEDEAEEVEEEEDVDDDNSLDHEDELSVSVPSTGDGNQDGDGVGEESKTQKEKRGTKRGHVCLFCFWLMEVEIGEWTNKQLERWRVMEMTLEAFVIAWEKFLIAVSMFFCLGPIVM